MILTARDPDRLQRVGLELGPQHAAFDATDFERLGRFFDELPTPIDHVLVTGPGPYYASLAEFDFDKARRDVESHLCCRSQVAGTPCTRFVREGPCSSWAAPVAPHSPVALISAFTRAVRAPRFA